MFECVCLLTEISNPEVTGQVMLQSSLLSADHLHLLQLELSAVSLLGSSRGWGRHSSIKSKGWCVPEEADLSIGFAGLEYS